MSFAEIAALHEPAPDDEVVAAALPEPEQVAPAVTEPDPEKLVEDVKPAAETPPAETKHDAQRYKAARAGERRALKEAEELRAENARLKAAAPKAAAPIEVNEATMADLESYAPEAAQALRAAKELEAENERLRALLPKPAPAFVPEQFDDETQELIDQVPELDAWRLDPQRQDDWLRAKDIDTNLRSHPDWKNKPLPERFTEVVRLRKDELAKAAGRLETPPKPKPATAEDALRVIEATAKTTPVSVGDLRGRAPPTQLTSKREAWREMSKEAFINSIPDE